MKIRSKLVLICTALLFMTMASSELRANLIYGVSGFGTGGPAVTGTITTDGAIGTLQATDILAYNISYNSLSNGIPVSFSIVSPSSSVASSVSIADVGATRSQLQMVPGSFLDLTPNSIVAIEWSFVLVTGFLHSHTLIANTEATNGNNNYFTSVAYGTSLADGGVRNVSNPIQGGSTGILLGTAVPEPSGFASASMGILALVLWKGRSTRKQRRLEMAPNSNR